MSNITVVKASGDRELFSIAKYRRSLANVGLSEHEIDDTVKYIEPELYDGITTHELYSKTFQLLKQKKYLHASKYSLKESLRELGPTGFPFEKLAAKLLQYEGYSIKLDQTMQGKCITHEIDIVAVKNNEATLVECKFHNSPGVKSAVQTALYVKARFSDLCSNNEHWIKHCLIMTNTKFTSQTIQYAECERIQLIAWGYPLNRGIESLIDKYKLYPITALIDLKKRDKRVLINAGIVLCNEILEDPNLLRHVGISQHALRVLQSECANLQY